MKRRFSPIRTRWTMTLALTLASLCTLVPAQKASAQLSNLDITTLIEGMRAEGMNDLLMHLVKTENFRDPILKQQIVINQHLLAQDRFNQLAEQAPSPQEALALRGQAADEFQLALEARRELIKTYNDNEQRPIWQTQLGMQLLGEYLEGMNQNASQFYEFGVPTSKQKNAYETAVVEALIQLEDADVRFFELQTRLAQEPDHVAKRVDTGLWDRMMEQFYSLRTQYALVQARYYVWLLPDDSEYFKDLGGKFARQRRTIADERKRLLAEALEVDQKLINTRAQANGILDGTRTLAGRIQIAQGQVDPGMILLDQVAQANQPTLVDLEAKLGKAFALHKNKRTSEAMSQLDQLSSQGLVTGNLLMRLLVVDARHRILLDISEKAPTAEKSKTLADAYDPYLKLMADPALGSSAAAIRNYIQQRWAANISPNTDLSKIPAIVAASMAQMLRSEGQNLVNQSLRAMADGDEAGSEQLAKEAAPKLERAQRIADDLLSRKDLDPTARANAMYEKALSIYFGNRTNIGKLVEAAGILTDLADQLPDQPRAGDALTSAMGGILRPLFAQQIPEAAPAYVRAMNVMLTKFPTLPATNNERYFYAMTVLLPQGKQQEAIDALLPVPSGHRDFYLSRQQIVRSRLAIIAQAEPEKRAALVAPVLEEVIALQGELEGAEAAATGEEAKTLDAVSGAVRIMRADLLSLQGKPSQAIQVLQNFEQDYTNDADLVREALGKRILMQAQSGDLAKVRNEASQMMASFPDDAAPVIDQVLTGLDNQIEKLRNARVDELVPSKQQAIDKQITDTSAAAQQLARMLVDWALTKGFNDDEMLPFQLVLAKSMRLAGNADEAVAFMLPLYNKYDNDLDVLSQTGEALYASAKKDNYIKAGEIFNTIISGVPPENGKYPAVWWNAWMRRIQLMDKLNEFTKDITMRVRQLEMTDPELGGEPYKSELKRLALKYGG